MKGVDTRENLLGEGGGWLTGGRRVEIVRVVMVEGVTRVEGPLGLKAGLGDFFEVPVVVKFELDDVYVGFPAFFEVF